MKAHPWKRQHAVLVLGTVFALVAMSCGDDDEAGTAGTTTAPAASEAGPETTAAGGEAAPAGEEFDVDPALMARALGTEESEGVPQEVLAAFTRAGKDVTPEQLEKALVCWKDQTCDTGTGGDVTVALADGFGENVWRQLTHMEFILQALTYPDIGKIVYTSAQGDTAKAISDFRSLIAQEVDIIATFPDSGEALLPTAREATQRGIKVIPYISTLGGTAGEDYLTYVAEDLCQLGKSFAAVLNEELGGTGKVALLGGTPGNPVSQAWQTCEEAELADGIEVVGKADTNWTREGTLQAVSSLLSQHPDLAGISYEYADGFLGGLQAFQAANVEPNIVLTLRTDEVGLFCEWKKLKDPDFKIAFSSGAGFDSRIALTAGMMSLAGEDVPPAIVVPAAMRPLTDEGCNENIPPEAPASTLVPDEVLTAMYS